MPGKRGRPPIPPKDAASRRSTQIGVRLTQQLRQQLDSARCDATPERTLSKEVELRLRASFGDAAPVQALFGGPVNHWFFSKIAAQIANIERSTGERWWRDRYTFTEVGSLVRRLLGFFEPVGDGTVPKNLANVAGGLGAALAGRALAEVQGALVGARQEAALRKNPTAELSRPAVPPRAFTKKERTAFLDRLDAK